MATTFVPIGPVTEALTAAWAAIAELGHTLDDDGWTSPSVLPGWTQGDIVAHIIGTESMLAGRDADEVPDVGSLAHVRNPIGELNEKWITQFRSVARGDVLAALDEIVAVRVGALRAMTQEDFDAETMTPAGADTYGRFMRIRIFDCWMHEVDLRDGIGTSTMPTTPTTPSTPTAPDALTTDWALAEIAASLPFVVGKRAGAAAGSTVHFRITGPAPRDVRIAVGERAAAVDAFDGGDDTATVRLTVDAVDLARLVGGRRDADPASVSVDGDAELAARIVERANYVI